MLKILCKQTKSLIFCSDQYFKQFNILNKNFGFYIDFPVIHKKSNEWILNQPITNFYISNDLNINVAELKQTKTRLISFFMIRCLSYETKVTKEVNKL